MPVNNGSPLNLNSGGEEEGEALVQVCKGPEERDHHEGRERSREDGPQVLELLLHRVHDVREVGRRTVQREPTAEGSKNVRGRCCAARGREGRAALAVALASR